MCYSSITMPYIIFIYLLIIIIHTLHTLTLVYQHLYIISEKQKNASNPLWLQGLNAMYVFLYLHTLIHALHALELKIILKNQMFSSNNGFISLIILIALIIGIKRLQMASLKGCRRQNLIKPEIELVKINTTNYYTIVLNKSGFTQPILFWSLLNSDFRIFPNMGLFLILDMQYKRLICTYWNRFNKYPLWKIFQVYSDFRL